MRFRTTCGWHPEVAVGRFGLREPRVFAPLKGLSVHATDGGHGTRLGRPVRSEIDGEQRTAQGEERALPGEQVACCTVWSGGEGEQCLE